MPKSFLFFLLLGVSSPALAQRTTNNAVTQSEDAFGRASGNERIGIYSPEDVRGFNPIEAGNARIEGLYFDQQGQPTNRLVDSSSIRVGYASRGYPFPAPTGIVDLKLDKYEGHRGVSTDFEIDAKLNVNGSVDFKLPLGENLGIAFGSGFRRGRLPFGRNGNFNSQAVMLSWTPTDGTEITPFFSRFRGSKLRSAPIIFPSAAAVPSRIPRSINLGQPWAFATNIISTSGVIAKSTIGAFRIEGGLFRSERDDRRSFADLLLGTDPSGTVANRLIIADVDNVQRSISGEVRLTRTWVSEEWKHGVVATIRGRDQSRAFGGQDRRSIGSSLSYAIDDKARPSFVFGPNDISAVRQMTFGLGYDVAWKGRGSLAFSAQKTQYRKQVDFASVALTDTVTRAKPLLFSANGIINLFPGVSAYGGYVRGLEESAVAPDIAINRSEAPPALRTTQKDAGLRFGIAPKLTLIAGAFEISKPYFNIDGGQRFRQLGIVRNRGIEISLAGTLASGLTIVAGSLFLDPQISGPDVTAHIIGSRPVGSFKRRTITNLDWKPKSQDAWSFDLAFEAVGPETANISNSFTGTARETVALGSRLRFKLGSAKLLLRTQVTNILNDYGWHVSSSGGFTYTPPRSFMLSISADL